MKQFIEGLNTASKAANPGLSTLLNVVSSLHLSKKEQDKSSQETSASQNVVVLGDMETLETLVQSAFDQPIYIPKTSPCGQTIGSRTYKGPQLIAGFLGSFQDTDTLLVQDFGAPASNSQYVEPVPKMCQEVKKCFLESGREQEIWNILDIGSSTQSLRYTPEPLLDVDLLQRGIKRDGQAGRESYSKRLGQWFLLSKQRSISDIYADSCGLCTWIHIICGTKVWYYHQGLTTLGEEDFDHVHAFASDATQDFPCGWSRIELSAGKRSFFFM